jgi:hypothetical protein
VCTRGGACAVTAPASERVLRPPPDPPLQQAGAEGAADCGHPRGDAGAPAAVAALVAMRHASHLLLFDCLHPPWGCGLAPAFHISNTPLPLHSISFGTAPSPAFRPSSPSRSEGAGAGCAPSNEQIRSLYPLSLCTCNE